MQAKNLSLLFLIPILFFIGCKKDEPDNTKALTGAVLAEVLYNPYERITPPANDTIIIPNTNASYQAGRQYFPKCFGNSGNTNFYFFRKSVSANNKKLLINFMGGGACWSSKNCFGKSTTTFFNFLNDVPDLFVKIAFQGILDAGNSSNPLKDYDVLFIPYCTGDLHIGSNDVTTYDDPYVASDPSAYSHRGHDNVLSVLKYIQSNYTQVTDVVVAGQSAGGYGAILNYPHIRQVFSDSTKFPSFNKMSLVADASNGAVINGFFSNIVSTQWGSGPNIPDWVVGSNYLTTGTPSIEDYISKITTEYPNDVVGQYTAAFDSTQRWFFNVMGIIDSGSPSYSDSSSYFGPGDARDVPDLPKDGSNTPSNCNWAINANTAMNGTTGSKYYFYRAPGDIHTITTSDTMYGLVSNGVNFNTWLKSIVSNVGTPTDVDCSLGSGSHPCTDKNFGANSLNDTLGRATSQDSFDAGKDLYETCFGP
ncbi:pectin acetylesterase-family hydrolase [Leptospira licerasiae]|uniref:Pectinacetylesterase domain protein n=1 Tax=Leptospira licerasiae str. MMD4847 TaxID=1049971 RepID=A0ABN0H5V5_9LEPT|nr:pectin acetylesterase-family hydrolase [Leptospira licerasiae]EIE00952.1 pectinacetylesterase domain protein [Leptospira licerasiae serovar Varillal str. VAR 010]EJZ41029.1 pectinacetylesterase domain protein [Leptospira licerasiae str. MMD4847]